MYSTLIEEPILITTYCCSRKYFFVFYFVFACFQLDAPVPYKDSSTPVEQAFGLYKAAFCTTTQLLPDSDPTPCPSDGSGNVFEKQDSTTQMDSATSAPLGKRSRRSLHRPPGLKGPYHRLGQPPNKSYSQKILNSEKGSEHSPQSYDQNIETSSTKEGDILSQHRNSALCVCWIYTPCWHWSASCQLRSSTRRDTS